ncbi:unnamed protein product [Adineta ricciae]|uniref:Innexin n=1 Tax=Adineta ricciae TaxID=249248 RepID=A0A814QE71_ADIRI|nr:unnamed protein product [Adineta ricciae]
MASKLFGAAQGLPWIKSIKSSNDDEHSDRVNHRYTAAFLLICAVVASGSPFVFNRITCWVPAQFVGAYTKYTDNYCWISNTYYVPTNSTVPHSKEVRERAEIGYYQWVPFIFLLSAFFFYLPRMLWRSMNTRSGIDLQYLVSKQKVKTITCAIENYCEPNDDDDGFGNRCCRTLLCTSGKRLGNYLSTMYLIVKLFYLLNSFTQLIFIHVVLGLPGWFYGYDVWYSIFVRNSVLTDSPYFPRITLCDLRIREVGNLHRYTVQCVLPINMLNEKLFSLVWFWLIYVFISNLISFAFTLYYTCVPQSRVNFIRDLYRKSVSKPNIDESVIQEFTRDFLMQDGVLILRILERNAQAFISTDVVNNLLRNYTTKQQSNRQHTSPPPSSEIVLNSSDV